MLRELDNEALILWAFLDRSGGEAEVGAEALGTAQVGMGDGGMDDGQLHMEQHPNAAGQASFHVHVLDIQQGHIVPTGAATGHGGGKDGV